MLTRHWLIIRDHLSHILLLASLAAAFGYFYSTSKSLKKRKRGNLSLVGVPGMYNLGNTCYANSLLQALASSNTFLNWIKTVDAYIDSSDNAKFLVALRDIIRELNDPNNRASSAADVTESLQAHRWHIPELIEQDLYELFGVFVSTWDEELAVLSAKRSFIPHEFSKMVASSEENLKKLAVEAKQNSLNRLSINYPSTSITGDVINGRRSDLSAIIFKEIKSVVTEEKRLRPPCTGSFITQLQCFNSKCRYKKIREEKFCVLSLSLPRISQLNLSLKKLLYNFFAEEYIKDATCDRCELLMGKKFGGLVRKQGFCKLPHLLIFRVERVGYSPSGFNYKRIERFKVPEFLNVRQFHFFASPINSNLNSGDVTNARTSNKILDFSSNQCSVRMSSPSTDPEEAVEGNSTNYNTSGDMKRYEFIDLLKYHYQLRAVVVHAGNSYSGHFITYRRGIGARECKIWYKTSDTDVIRVSFAEVAHCQAYMMYYDLVSKMSL